MENTVKTWKKTFRVIPEGGKKIEFELEVEEGLRDTHVMSEKFVRKLFKLGISKFTYNHPWWGDGTRGELKFSHMKDGEVWVNFLINDVSHNYYSVGKIEIY